MLSYWLNPARLPLVIAHRGASAYAPENTVSAFRLAMAQGADGAELDVALSADGAVVVIHDDTVDRTTNGTGRVAHLTLAALRVLDAGQGERIPTLAEVIEATADATSPFLLNIELKAAWSSSAPALTRAVVEVVRATGSAERVLFSSFSPFVVRSVAQLAPEVPRAWLYQRAMPRWARALGLRLAGDCHFEHPEHALVNASLVQRCVRLGRRVNTWTVNDIGRAVQLARLGVHGLIGDDPLLLIEAREVAERGAK
ncbi:MAG: glycerophosphodiester phosphodiesterase family protein [Anaerolineae bacterium]|nr:hypothetical protein [Thermoflexales bacterium]MDW8054171.1 glycerophosphodiester phosphodiesterase family protein [Anaerolineae bacterium]